MKNIGSPKGTGKYLNFWGKYEEQVSEEMKEKMYRQYFSTETLFIYCDASRSESSTVMSVACSYVYAGEVIVKQSYAYPSADCYQKIKYGELKAIIFALNNFKKHMRIGKQCKNIIIYSDVHNIEATLNNEITFKKNKSLNRLKNELIVLFQQKKKENPGTFIDIRYLSLDQKRHNPFAKSCHNAANRMLKNI